MDVFLKQLGLFFVAFALLIGLAALAKSVYLRWTKDEKGQDEAVSVVPSFPTGKAAEQAFRREAERVSAYLGKREALFGDVTNEHGEKMRDLAFQSGPDSPVCEFLKGGLGASGGLPPGHCGIMHLWGTLSQRGGAALRVRLGILWVRRSGSWRFHSASVSESEWIETGTPPDPLMHAITAIDWSAGIEERLHQELLGQ